MSRGYEGKKTEFFDKDKKGRAVSVDKNPGREYNHPIINKRGWNV